MVKISISGKANSGKNTLASMLVDCFKFNNSKEKLVGFADPIKNIVLIMFPEADKNCLFGASELRSNIISDKYVDSRGEPLTYRQALIDIGTSGRRYNEDIWVNYLENDLNQSKNIDTYICYDQRYINEYNFLKKSGFYTIRILRPNLKKIDHNSEIEQEKIPNDMFDYVIYNDKDLDYLKSQVKSIYTQISQLMQ